ncbi:magnesium transporter [candidate division WOR-3 bacterium]|uniref:Magnesium transporter MgtE n=1 Tax=candidate division WOR-3 bacterium TaxID=2052148 RepID=A0A660SKU3_UNCW3|nr:MAG: magnesium transporter [candidate division WOR-3 bacterium]
MRVILPELKELIRAKEAKLIRDLFRFFDPADVAEVWDELTPEERVYLISTVNIADATDIIETLKAEQQREILNLLPEDKVKAILDRMSPDDRVDLIAELPREEQERFLKLMASEEEAETEELLTYPEDSAGGLMTTDFAYAYDDMKVSDVLRHLRKIAKDLDDFHYVFIIDRNKKIKGQVSLKDLITASPRQPITKIMDQRIVSVLPLSDQEEVARVFAKYDRPSIPVVDRLGRLKGIITSDDVIDVISEEATEDMHRFAALTGETEDYLATRTLTMAKRRITWLILLVFAGFLSGLVIETYASVIRYMVALSFFIPILTGSGGNAGMQSATMVIRALATGGVSVADFFRILKKEIIIGIVCGLALGVATGLRALLIQRSPILGVTVGLAMFGAVTLATALGGIIPIIFKKLGIDPALTSGPLITTIMDALTLLIYFGAAITILRAF